jgi:phosphohistidine phosphatase
MDLILWRHAEAVDAPLGGDDMARTLTPRGERQAAKMAAWLNQHLPATARVLASPARRTQQTAAALDRRFKTVASVAPGASVTALLEAVRWPDSKEPVLVIGHQPTLGLTAAHLLAGVDQTWSVKKGAVWWLRCRDRIGGGQVVLVTVRGPENV